MRTYAPQTNDITSATSCVCQWRAGGSQHASTECKKEGTFLPSGVLSPFLFCYCPWNLCRFHWVQMILNEPLQGRGAWRAGSRGVVIKKPDEQDMTRDNKPSEPARNVSSRRSQLMYSISSKRDGWEQVGRRDKEHETEGE